MLEGYDMGLSDRDDERSPPKLEIPFGYRPTILSPALFHPTLSPHAMDISSVRFRPVPVMAQAEMTSTHGHPRLNLPQWGKVNISSFVTGDSSFRYTRLVFGLSSSPTLFSVAMFSIFRKSLKTSALLYIDDFLVMSENLENH